jgi:hypothetical protein
MSQEITATASLSYAKGNISTVTMGKSGSRFDVSGSNYERGTQTITTSSPQEIGLGSIGTPGWFFIQNNDSTNYVTIYDATSGNAFLKLKPGEFATGRFAAAAPAAQSNTSSVVIEFMIVEA